MMRREYLVGGLRFKTQKQLKEYVRWILHAAPSGEPLNDRSLAFMNELLSLHPQADQKIGSGVKAMVVRQNPVFRDTRGFWIIRTDGSETDFSFLECISASNHRAKVLSAARGAVVGQILAFREAWFANNADVSGYVVCPLTGDAVTVENCHVDHIPPQTFVRLWEQFMEWQDTNFDKVALLPGQDNSFGDVFADQQFSADWSDFHANCARLRVTSVYGNLVISRQEAHRIAQ